MKSNGKISRDWPKSEDCRITETIHKETQRKEESHEMWKFILLCCCLLNSLFLFALEENVTFHSSFEGTIQAEKALGSPQCVNRRDARYSEPGISGKALRLQAGEFLRYKQHRNFNPEQGTVCFWMRPVDWDPAAPTPGYMWLMSIAGDTAEGGHVQIFKMPSPMMMGYVGNYPQVKEITHSTEDWKKGEWVFLALCWERGRMTFYRNGKILGKTTLD